METLPFLLRRHLAAVFHGIEKIDTVAYKNRTFLTHPTRLTCVQHGFGMRHDAREPENQEEHIV
ncbi:hypothetical protein E2P84_43650 [Burkholderia cepacia]|uniref:Uncharacterized protein n=1 Tax=Burkholderia cepacia TaxID=292 RepID=A0AAQ1YRD7_BURCE|nr:hypothetical protein [Burkholderia cepacia]MDC6102989.1 hypothetical protein [Burkholderia cepacia]MDN7916009.1 hypothetical protein [Burkholderia cepacia]TES61347.1 hypothetical protein E2P84_43650 [Burkholderia cepacia]TES96536.1 hypothetical protein E3D36_35675 [Burkholderia cepacia]TEU31728.1 hypothetical protein E3D39_37925 [Burkholderia cepacia]